CRFLRCGARTRRSRKDVERRRWKRHHNVADHDVSDSQRRQAGTAGRFDTLVTMRFAVLPPNNPPARGAYFWLVYLAIPIATATFAYPPSARVALVTAFAIAGCLPLYFWSFWLGDRRILLAVGGLVALGLVTAPINT